MVVFDATALLILLVPGASSPQDESGSPILYAKERIDGLVEELTKAKSKILIPAPALAEALVRAGEEAAMKYVARISRSASFNIADFDTLAALEVAAMTRDSIAAGDKRSAGEGTWAKIKYDRQIVAIAKVNRARIVYSDDKNVRSFGKGQGLNVVSLGELPVPDTTAQRDWVRELHDV
jgi:hypothetical protein